MKNLLITASLTLVLAGTTFAQGRMKRLEQMDPEKFAAKSVERMDTELDLTEKQEQQVLEINTAFARELKSQMSELSREREEMKALKDRHRAALNEVLTPTQQQKLDQLRSERKGKRNKLMDRLQALNLTDEQKEQIKAIHSTYIDKYEAARTANPDKEARKKAMKAIMKEEMKEIKPILTQEQLDQLKEMKKDRKDQRGKKGRF